MSKISKRTYIIMSICILWLLIIFIFSAMNATSSSNLTDVVLKVVEYVRAHNRIVDSIFTRLTRDYSLFYIIRKMAHMFVFCVLQIIAFNVFRAFNMSFIKSAILSILTVFGYACMDEFHQLFVDGRSGQFSDVIIDTIGGTIGLFITSLSSLLVCLVKKIKLKYLSVECCKNK